MKKKRKNNKNNHKMIDLLFSFAIVICCIVMIYALVVFVHNCNNLSKTTNKLVDAYNDYFRNHISNSQTNINNEIVSGEINYAENLVEYTIKLQELEAQSASTNILTFLYTFLSGTLIGVATYLTKKSADSVSQIKENKELIDNLDSRSLFSNLYMYVQRTYSTIQIFGLSLDSINDSANRSNYLDKYIPRLNELTNEFKLFTQRNANSICILTENDQKIIINEINHIESLLDEILKTNKNKILQCAIESNWKLDLAFVKKSIK